MKFDLDHIARENISKLRGQYKEKCKNSKDDPKMFAEHDKLISASSLGVKHFMRELGQFLNYGAFSLIEDTGCSFQTDKETMLFHISHPIARYGKIKDEGKTHMWSFCIFVFRTK
ncbi:protein NEL-like [Platysternon megacephalum]|uniref:Protein NEL-like n=1 Tax=Platysternon megacephalum TaxID=55544 RepID=A0A4D9DT45_9SAUR|nr:protein NEL-like [Platysternon megacephalum]